MGESEFALATSEPSREAVLTIPRRTAARRRRRRTLALNRAERALIIGVGDALAGALGCLLANAALEAYLRRPLPLPISAYLILSAAWLVALFMVDGYNLPVPESPIHAAVILLKAMPVVTVVGALYFFAAPYRVTRPVIVLSLFSGAVCVLALRLILLRILRSPVFAKKALLLGGGDLLKSLPEALHAARFEYRVVGATNLRGDEFPSLPRIRPLDDLLALLTSRHVDEIIVGSKDLAVNRELIERCFTQGIRLETGSSLIERYTGRVPLEAVDAAWFLCLPSHDLMGRPYLLIRRVADLVLSTIVSIPFLFLLPFIAIAIKLDSPGPVFFRQFRVGQSDRVFKLFKLRTMVANAEAGGSCWAQPGDQRVTRVGRILRASRLDELPQILNVLRGEMSFIGPRPEQPSLVHSLEKALPHYRARHAVKPGISGWAQVKNGYASSVSETALKLEYDLFYVKNQSLRLDLQIAFHTFFTVIGLRGR